MKPPLSLCPTCQRPLRSRSKMTACPYCLAAAMSNDLGLTGDGPSVSGFELQHILGQGSAGIVWFAVETAPPSREVALKILKPGLAEREAGTRFKAEMKALALMDYPSIAKVFSSGQTRDQRPYFAMEWIDGEALTTACHNLNLTAPERLKIFDEICSAIAHAHECGIIHRDLKPSNILLGPDRIPKVIDFGVARATETLLADRTLVTRDGQIIGTPAYMSPEQAAMRGELLDERSDIYSLGVILFELLTGELPISRAVLDDAPYDEVLREIRTGKTPDITKNLPAGISGKVGQIVSTALAKKPENRFQSVPEFATALREAIHLPHARSIRWMPWTAALVVAGAAAILIPKVWPPEQVVHAETPPDIVSKPTTPPPAPSPKRKRFLSPHEEPYWMALAETLVDQDPGLAIAAWAEARRISIHQDRPKNTPEPTRLIDAKLAQLPSDFATSIRLMLAREFRQEGVTKASPISNEMRDLIWARNQPTRDSFQYAANTLGPFYWDRVRWGFSGREAFISARDLAEKGQKKKAITRYRCGLVMCSIADQPQDLMIAAASALAELEGREFETSQLSELIESIPDEEIIEHADFGYFTIIWLKAFRNWSDPDSPALAKLEGLKLLPGWRPLVLKARGQIEAASKEAAEELAKIDPSTSPYLAKVLRDIQK